MKWVISLVGVALVVGFILIQRSGVKVSYVNGLPLYSSLPNREFIFQQDCYIIAMDKTEAAYPLVAGHAQLGSLPVEVSDAHVGSTFPGGRILATVKTGSRVKLISVRREQGPDSMLISFEILFLDEAERPYPRLDARLVLDPSPTERGEPPRFIETVIVPRVKV